MIDTVIPGAGGFRNSKNTTWHLVLSGFASHTIFTNWMDHHHEKTSTVTISIERVDLSPVEYQLDVAISQVSPLESTAAKFGFTNEPHFTVHFGVISITRPKL